MTEPVLQNTLFYNKCIYPCQEAFRVYKCNIMQIKLQTNQIELLTEIKSLGQKVKTMMDFDEYKFAFESILEKDGTLIFKYTQIYI